MAMEVSGFDDLFGTLELLGNVGNKVGKKAVKAGLDEMLDQMKKDAPKDTGDSADHLEITRLKQYKGGSVWGACGISSKNWEETKALWFQHFGYENKGARGWFKGRIVRANVGWMTDSFEKSNKKAEAILEKTVADEIDRILK